MNRPWRSLEQGSEKTVDEFPAGFEGLHRREFVRLLGGSAALFALAGCRRPEAHLVPFDRAVEWSLPGKFLYYATSMPFASGAVPLLVATVDGRPVKVEGNSLHPAAGRGSTAFAQASLAELYHPGRSRAINCAGREVSVEELRAFLDRVRTEYQNSGEGLAFLVQNESSPTQDRLRRCLEADFPGMLWATYEPLGSEGLRRACTLALGNGMTLLPRFERADVIVSLDSDFLNPAEAPPGFSNGFYVRRDPGAASMNRLFVAESYVSLTGGMADHRLRVKASEVGGVLFAVAQAIAAQIPDCTLRSALAACPPLPGSPDSRWIRGCVQDLLSHRGRSILWVGEDQPWEVHLLAIVLNRALGNIPMTIEAVQRDETPSVHIRILADAMRAGRVRHLFLFGGNPVYDAPAELDFASLLSRVSESFHLSLFSNETSRLVRWNVPAAHFLESWGDALAFDGTVSAVQPMILPLWKGWSALRILSALANEDSSDTPAAVRKTFSEQRGNDAGEWTEFLRTGFLKGSAWPTMRRGMEPSSSVVRALGQVHQIAASEGLELVFLRSSQVNDGRFAENAWLQETPDFVTKLVWDNAALLAPATAAQLGIQEGDLLEISAGQRSIQAAALLAPSHAENSIAISLGYGRQIPDAVGKGWAKDIGFNAYPLRESGFPRFRCGIQIRRTDERHLFARTQEIHAIEGDDLVRQTTLEHYRLLPQTGIQRTAADATHSSSLQWAMAVDLNACIGCNACLVACQAENNVPVVGKEEVRRGRDMAWIRIDRYFVGDPAIAEIVPQMVACQHCENAPCEPVCPVHATVHNEEGLNLMVYNRCIGTRYCSNNCPWKVRRFNFFDYNERPLTELALGPLAVKGMPESIKLSKNPNVTIRMRGVMEKCTFCIQRIEEAKISRLVRAGASDPEKLPLPAFQTACQQACPAGALVFGNEADPNSQVARLRSSSRGYTILDFLNARPRVTYLTRIRNPQNGLPNCI